MSSISSLSTHHISHLPLLSSPSNNLSGNRANPVLNAAGKDDKNHTKVYRLSDITVHPDVGLTRGGMILIGLMSGGDYQQGGVARCGTMISHGLARCGFGDTLYQAANNLNREDLETFLGHWRHEVRHELCTNSQGHIGKKQPSLAKSIPETFPDIDILLSYTRPITSESMGRAKDELKLTWSKEPDLGKLAATCELYFEWGYKEAIIKRFRSVIWHSAVQRILRRAVLDLDAKNIAYTDATPHTPQKKKKLLPEPVGTPSKMIAKHFSSLTLGELKGYASDCEDNDDDDEPLIVKVHSSRNHVSTDGILEYRLEIAPAQLARIAESGIKGLRQPEGPDEWADDDEEDGKKLPPDPDSHMRVWMPACMVGLVEPHLVEDFEAVQRRKQEKAAARGIIKSGRQLKAVAAGPITNSEQDVTKRKGTGITKGKSGTKLTIPTGVHQGCTHNEVRRFVRDLTKGVAKPQGSLEGTRGNLKASTKPSSTIRDKSHTTAAPPRPASNEKSSSVLNGDSDPMLKRNEMAPSHPSRLCPNKQSASDSSALSRAPTKPRNAPVSDYLEISESEVEHCPSRSTKLALELPHIPFCDEDHLSDLDDPFDGPAPPLGLASAARGQVRKNSYSSSESDSISFQPKKSPRKTSEHTSTSTRLITDDINEDAQRVNRPCSPSPLRPFIYSTTTRKASQAPAHPMRLIDISSDSDGDEEIMKVPPLELARARAKGNIHSKYLMQRSLKDYTNYTQPTRKQHGLKNATSNVHQDVIDLT